jgi:hypothetical protein
MPPSEPRLIRDYLQVLAARLPASIVDELAGFARVNPARWAARRLLGLGPVVGGCWVAALAMAGSMLRVGLCARALRPALAG